MSASLAALARHATVALAPFALGLACGVDAEAPEFAEKQQDIYGGRVDTAHSAVISLFNQAGLACSGTNLRSINGHGFLLTAAHCVTVPSGTPALGVVAVPPDFLVVVPGSDASLSTVAYPAVQVHVAAGYSGVFGVDDVAIVHFFYGDEPAPASIEALGAAEDDLAVDDVLLLVGFGRTETNPNNTQRRQVQRLINGIDSELVLYSQLDGRGSCSGDSGGPGLVGVGGGERVALVISGGLDFGGDPCSGGFGFGTRVSAYEEFIENAVGGFERCDTCRAEAAPECEADLAACDADGSCAAYLACDGACFDETCRSRCVALHPEGYLALRGFSACLCAACSECGEAFGCARLECGFAERDQLCPCVSDNCCEAAATCQADAVCEACVAVPGFEFGCAESAPLQTLAACLGGCSGACGAP